MSADPLPSIAEASARDVIGQLFRFAIAGGGSAIVYSAVYLLVAAYLPRHLAILAVPPAFAAGVASGFILHSRWSFRGHDTGTPRRRLYLKFVLVQGLALALNAWFTWLLTGVYHSPSWAPLVPSMLVTPLITFWLQRRWVFGLRSHYLSTGS